MTVKRPVSPRVQGVLGCFLFASCTLFAATKRQDDIATHAGSNADPYEWKIFPVIGGNSDIGFLFGATGLITRLGPKTVPYLWTLRLQLSMSVKKGPLGGTEFPVHQDFATFDWRHPSGRWRLGGELSFNQAANSGYYGLGNSNQPLLYDPVIGSRVSQYLRSDLLLTGRGAFQFSPHWNVLFGLGIRRSAPSSYEGSILARDLAASSNEASLGVQVAPVAFLGLDWDTRDSEIHPSRGGWCTAALRAMPSPFSSPNLAFLHSSLSLRVYIPLASDRLVFALRQVSELTVGNPPIMEFARSSGFDAISTLGGSDGVRGIPEGRYQGRIRLIANGELRWLTAPFTLFGQRFQAGLAGFFEGGRVWAGWTPRPDLDGGGIGLHWAAGGGWRLRWGETTMIRMDFAYSPEIEAIDPTSPFCVYFDLGHLF